MTQTDIIKLARECGASPYVNRHFPGLTYTTFSPEKLEAFFNAAYAMGAEQSQDAKRYALVRRGQHWSVLDGIGDVLRGEELDAVVDAAMKGEQQ